MISWLFSNYSDLFEIYKKTFFKKSILDIFKNVHFDNPGESFLKHFYKNRFKASWFGHRKNNFPMTA